MAWHQPEIEALEGRLIAHRKLLVQLLMRLPPADQADMREWLTSASVMHDGQEDPGAVADTGAALELAISDEMRLLRERLDALAPR
ncbi:hypothetical protein [Paracoccus laeviglucosivorans]|uniref:Uncharacterized protein n=1 Tax=Paracoccus laeviglucosivorans TaxID=1197861 RepID=A0A521BD72_9RHOB|nr:hypothetical protein [Paracoccus laeviglucosivorans]SMO45023.1 hypothetical protein SAMN06265221_102240 [Paracoccus laeviglucosivorans]